MKEIFFTLVQIAENHRRLNNITEAKMASALGVSINTYRSWRERKLSDLSACRLENMKTDIMKIDREAGE